MEEEKIEDPFKEYESREVANTKCEHYFTEDPIQDPNSNLLSVICTKCPSGIMIDSDKFKIENGKVVDV